MARARTTPAPRKTPSIYCCGVNRPRRALLSFGATRLIHQRFENRLSADGNHAARAKNTRYASRVEEVVVLRRDHSADEHQDVLATQLLEFLNHFGDQRLVPTGQRRHP